MKRCVFLLLIFLMSHSIFGQVKLADILYSNFEYELAAKFYSEADSLNSQQMTNHALCYYLNNNFYKAVPLFEKAINKDTGNIFLKYHYGVSLKSIGRNQSAKKILSNLYSKDSLNPYLELHLNSIDSLKKWDTIQFFKKLAGINQLNTKASEFSPSFYDNGIYYITEEGTEEHSSGKNINLIENNDTLSPNEKKAFIEKLKGELAYGTTVSPKTIVYQTGVDVTQLFKDYAEAIPAKSIDTTKVLIKHNGFNITSYDTDFNGEKVFYTRHPYVNKWAPDASLHPLLYQGKHHRKKNKLTHRRRVHVRFLSNTYGAGEVSVTADGKTIYFVSDKKRGFGGTDIYVSHRKKTGKWKRAKNLGPQVNTQFNEESPRIYDDSILFFSSNGWPGYGKADIFKCKVLNDTGFNLKHMPYPVNSSGEDIHFILHPFDECIGVLNSDRPDGAGDEDLYFAYMIPVEPYVKGYIRLRSDSSIQKESFVRLFNDDNQELNQTTTQVNGIYRFSLLKGNHYKILATKIGLAGYLEIEADETLFRNEKNDIYLDSAITIQGYVMDEKKNKVGNATVEFYNKKDSLITSIFTRKDGFFQIVGSENEDYFIMANKNEKAGSYKLNVNSKYKTDSIIPLFIYNNRAIISGIVIDTNGIASNNAVVRLLDSNNVEIERITTKEDGAYQFTMTIFHHYRIIATNYGMAEDTSFYIDTSWGPEQRRNLYLKGAKTVQGYTFFKDTNKVLDDVNIAIESGFDSKYITIYSDKNGFFQFPLFNDSLIYMIGEKKKMKGTTTVKIDSNYTTTELHHIFLHRTTTDAHGIVIYYNDSIAANVVVEQINKEGKIVSETYTDSLGKFYFELNTDSDYEIYATEGELEAIENIHTGVLWNKNDNIIMKLSIKGTPTYGLVVDADNRDPLSFVKITLTDSATNLKNITYTNDQGVFEMSLKTNSTNYVKLEKENYFTKTITIKIGDTIPKVIDLNKEYNLSLLPSGFKVNPIYFEFDSHEITKTSKKELDILIQILKERKERSCTIFGYTDCRGKNSYNLILGKKRARSVQNYLSKNGINIKRINTIGKGATNYVNNCYHADQCTEAEHHENRRCEFEIDDIK